TIFMEYGVKDFFQDVEAPPRFVRLGDGDRVLLVANGGEPVTEMDANVKAASGSVYLEFKYDDVDGDTQRFRLSISGELYLGQVAKGEMVFKQRVVDISFKVFDDEAGRMLAKLLEIEYGEKASPTYLVVGRSIPDSGTFFLHDKDGLMRVSHGRTKLTLGEDFENILGKEGLENLRNKLGSKEAALALVYVGEDNSVHSVWSQELEFSFKHHPIKEDGVIGLHVVRVDGVDGVDLDGKGVRLTSTTGGYELSAKVEDGEVRIPVEEPYIDAMGPRKYLKMSLPDGHVLGLRLEVDESGKLNAKLAVYRVREDAFRDLRLLEFIPELGEHYRGESDESMKVMLRNILVGEYAEEGGTKPVFMSMDGNIPREILDRLNKNPEHTLLEINAISLFKSMGESIVAIEKKLEKVSGMEKSRIIDIIMSEADGTEVLVECKHGYESDTDPDQIKDYFTYAKSHNNKIRLFIGNDITGDGAKDYVKHAIELHEQLEREGLDVPLEIYIKGELKSLREVKQIVGG
ncbi:MAG: restriction endonuclease, partial [Candidatus Brockarchaeota archaeon]|nr:restriction endonuclease [Candidatus Brockarchaeota archaeon]